jgi:hypothetical protein
MQNKRGNGFDEPTKQDLKAGYHDSHPGGEEDVPQEELALYSPRKKVSTNLIAGLTAAFFLGGGLAYKFVFQSGAKQAQTSFVSMPAPAPVTRTAPQQAEPPSVNVALREPAQPIVMAAAPQQILRAELPSPPGWEPSHASVASPSTPVATQQVVDPQMAPQQAMAMDKQTLVRTPQVGKPLEAQTPNKAFQDNRQGDPQSPQATDLSDRLDKLEGEVKDLANTMDKLKQEAKEFANVIRHITKRLDMQKAILARKADNVSMQKTISTETPTAPVNTQAAIETKVAPKAEIAEQTKAHDAGSQSMVDALKPKGGVEVEYINTTYRIRALIPNQAWIEDKRGRVVVVIVGDSLGTDKVTKIDAQNYRVETTGGTVY